MSSPALLAYLSASFAAAIGLTMLFQSRRAAAHWLFLLGMMGFALERLCAGLAADTNLSIEAANWQSWALLWQSFLPAIWLPFSLTYARGEGSQFLRRWRLLLLGLFLAPVVIALAFKTGLLPSEPDVQGQRHVVISAGGRLLQFVLLVGSLLTLLNLERTFRASVGTLRWRIKFMIIGLGLIFAVLAYVASQALLYQEFNPSLQMLISGALLLGGILICRTLLRPGHFEVSVYPSQSLLHNSVTIMLAGLYLFIVGVLANLARLFGGVSGFELKAMVVLILLVLLSVVLLSERMRLHGRRFISRYFHRPMYDYRTVWRTFAEATARCLEEQQLCGSVAKLVSSVFQALSVTIWLVDDRKEKLTFAASTAFTPAQGGGALLQKTEATELVRLAANRPDPIDIDASRESWAAALRRAHPDEFRKGGNRFCAPMVAGGELLGIIVAGDRVGGISFSVQDLDLLKSMTEQAAASLLNIQLAQKLSQAKQLEAFQAMSAFFVHDLKNTASTLSLMLQNLPLHYNDPEFREDALRGISKTVSHINELINRLTVLRHELAIQPIDSDLNYVVSETIDAEKLSQGVQLQQQLEPLPKVRIDPTQIQKVLTNLLLNAREAVGPDGHIQVTTQRRNGWAVLAVTDDGCGMPPEFIHTRLFKPFQTTKKKGIGIGMFHCKMIVEAHHGRIEVESEPGKGTAFRVLLPLS